MSEVQPPKLTPFLPGSLLTKTAHQISKRLGYPDGHAELTRELLGPAIASEQKNHSDESNSPCDVDNVYAPFCAKVQKAFCQSVDSQHTQHLLKDLREFGGGDLAVTANRIGTSKGDVGRWERGTVKPQFTTLLRMLSAHDGTWQTQPGRQVIAGGLRDCLSTVLEMIQASRKEVLTAEEFDALHYTLFSKTWWLANLDLIEARRSKSEVAIARADEKLVLLASAVSARVSGNVTYTAEDLNQLVRKYGEAWCVLLFLIPYRDWAFDDSADNDL